MCIISYFSDNCSIQLEDKVILTGGGNNPHRSVNVYNTQGWLENLPDLKQGRYSHGCGYYINNENKEVNYYALSSSV